MLDTGVLTAISHWRRQTWSFIWGTTTDLANSIKYGSLREEATHTKRSKTKVVNYHRRSECSCKD